MNDINKMPPKRQYCPCWEVCKYPWVCPDIGEKKPKRTDKRTETHASDLISRQALCEYALNQKDKNITTNDIMRFPSAQPSSSCGHEKDAQSVRKRGKWIPNMDRDVVNGYRCSQCGAWHVAKYKFCHNCGADMKEESE